MSKAIGFGLESNKDSSVTRSGINTHNITISDPSAQQALTGKTLEQTKADIYTTTSTETAKENSGAIGNNFDKDKVQSEINLQVDVTQRFDKNRQDAGLTVENIAHAVQLTGQLVDQSLDAIAFAKKAEQELKQMSPQDKEIFGDLITALNNDARLSKNNQNIAPIVAAGEALTMAGAACARTPQCLSAVVNLFGASAATYILNSGEEKKEAPPPKGVPSTSGNSATGMPPNKEDKDGWNEQKFNVDNKQLGKKLGKHVSDFGRNPASASDRQYVQSLIENIGKNPDRIVRGTFAGQGPAGTRGAVQFRIKGQDVVVTKPNGTFVTILRNGVTNLSVKQALNGAK